MLGSSVLAVTKLLVEKPALIHDDTIRLWLNTAWNDFYNVAWKVYSSDHHSNTRGWKGRMEQMDNLVTLWHLYPAGQHEAFLAFLQQLIPLVEHELTHNTHTIHNQHEYYLLREMHRATIDTKHPHTDQHGFAWDEEKYPLYAPYKP